MTNLDPSQLLVKESEPIDLRSIVAILIDAMAHCSFNGWGVTTVDSLDTLWLMGGILHL